MATKKELISIITGILRENPGREVVITKYQGRLRNGRGGMHAYSLCYRPEGACGGGVFARPWAGADICWEARLPKLLKAELLDIAGRCMMLTHP